MQKSPQLRTVVNKLNNIHAEYRYFDMEVIAGDHDLITTVVSFFLSFPTPLPENSLTPRLTAERIRLLIHIRFFPRLLELASPPRTRATHLPPSTRRSRRGRHGWSRTFRRPSSKKGRSGVGK